jgi:hypothetical protein
VEIPAQEEDRAVQVRVMRQEVVLMAMVVMLLPLVQEEEVLAGPVVRQEMENRD